MRKLSDSEMLQIMSRENMEDWAPSLAMEIETVRAAVLAFAAGRIALLKVSKDARKETIRRAPSFVAGNVGNEGRSVDSEVGKYYTALTLATFLGWTWRSQKEIRANAAVQRALGALELEEQKIIEKIGSGRGDGHVDKLYTVLQATATVDAEGGLRLSLEPVHGHT